MLVTTLALRLELDAQVTTVVSLRGRVGGARPGRKVLTLVHALVAGGSHIDHVDVLRCGGTEKVLAFRVMAPSTVGSFLRASPSDMFAVRSRRGRDEATGVVVGGRPRSGAAGGRRRVDDL